MKFMTLNTYSSSFGPILSWENVLQSSCACADSQKLRAGRSSALRCTPMFVIQHGFLGVVQVLRRKWLGDVRAASTDCQEMENFEDSGANVPVVHDERIRNLLDLAKGKEKGRQTVSRSLLAVSRMLCPLHRTTGAC